MNELFARSERLAQFLFDNDTVGVLIACNRARINPAIARPPSTTSAYFQTPWDPTASERYRIEKLTFIATYCIRNTVTHRFDDASFATAYDTPGDHYYRYDVASSTPYWSTATALVLPCTHRTSNHTD